MHTVTARTVRYHARTHARCETMIAVLITTHALTRDTKLPRERYAFMTARTSLGCKGGRSGRAVCFNRCDDVVNPMTISAHRRSRHAPGECLSMNALHELRTLTLVALAAGRGNIDLGNGRLRVGCRENVVAVMTVSANSSADVALGNSFC